MSTTTTTVELSAADLGMTTTRKGNAPTTIPALVSALRDTVAEWDHLAADTTRTNGGQIASKVRKAKSYVTALIVDHNADVDAVRDTVATRAILKLDNDAVIAAIIPAPKATTAKATKAAA